MIRDAILAGESLLCQPTLIQAFADRVEGYKGGILEDIFGKPPESETIAGHGIVPLKGIIGKGLMPIEKMLGACDLEDFIANVRTMEADDSVHTIVIDCDSPGGTVTGVMEAAYAVANSKKPTVAYIGGMGASAAYWIASQCDRCIAAPSATVGSVGVFRVALDSTRAFEMMGLRTDVIKSGEHKGAGVPGTALSQAQRDNYQAQATQLHDIFKAAVLSKRSGANIADMEGQCFYGFDAATRGLVTGLADCLDDIIPLFEED